MRLNTRHILEIRGAGHAYSGVPVLSGIDFSLRSGEVHALVGENGSGKSTLIRIMTGALQLREGEIFLDGEKLSLTNPMDAQRNGIGVVHQDYHLFPDLTVAQNIFGINAPPPRRRWTRTVDRDQIESVVEGLLDELGIKISSARLVRTLGPAERKFVEIASAMLLRPNFLILDEPTASLEPEGSQSVLRLMNQLRENGVGLMFVSHRLDEIMEISNHVTTLRDGEIVKSVPTSEASTELLAEWITGGHVKTVPASRARGESESGEIAVAVKDLRTAPERKPMSFDVRRGEIFGLTGLLGCGAETVVHMLGGATPLSGSVALNGAEARIRSPRDSYRLGIGFIPEDRKTIGLVAEQSIATNISLPSLSSISRLGVLRKDEIDRRAGHYKNELSIKARSTDAPVWSLSGGNQQKVMLAKWLASGVDVLVIEEPTHGIDIGGKAQVHELLRQFADSGGTVIVASTDVPEVMELCDRIGVMRHGVLTRTLAAGDLNESAVKAMGAEDPEEMLEHLIEEDQDAAAA